MLKFTAPFALLLAAVSPVHAQVEGATEADAVSALKQATRNYAKRQLTWFRNQTPDWARTA